MLFEKDWYSTYWQAVESKGKNRSAACTELKMKLLNECYSTTRGKEIELRVPLILDAVDNLKGINKYSYLEVSQVDVWWKCDLPSKVKPGTTIPKEELQMELLLNHSTTSSDSLLETMWTTECPMKIHDKLAIICPRKRTLQGCVVLDLMKVNVLYNALKKVIKEVTDIDDLVSEVIQSAQADCKVELDKLQNECEEASRKLRQSEDEYQQKYDAVVQKRNGLIEKYTKIAEERTKNGDYGNNYEEKNKNTIGMFSYMYAICMRLTT